MGDRCMGYWRGMSLQVPDERIEQAPMGAMKLFFGCRRSDEDFLYRDELLQFHEQGECGWTACRARWLDCFGCAHVCMALYVSPSVV